MMNLTKGILDGQCNYLPVLSVLNTIFPRMYECHYHHNFCNTRERTCVCCWKPFICFRPITPEAMRSVTCGETGVCLPLTKQAKLLGEQVVLYGRIFIKILKTRKGGVVIWAL
jgi:hypothetical protein